MVRIKRGTIKRRRHKKILKLVKGHRGVRSRNYRKAIESLMHKLQYAYRDRRNRKRDFRRLWIVRLNATLRKLGVSYSRFMGELKKKNVNIDRKNLQEMAISDPKGFEELVNYVMSR